MTPWSHDSLIHLLPWFLDSMIPCSLPWFLWNLWPTMPPFAINGIFFREVGGCWQGPLFWKVPGSDPLPPFPKSTLFWTPQKNGSECSRHHFLTDFCRFWSAVCSTSVTGSQKHRNWKSVFGLRRRVRIACVTFLRNSWKVCLEARHFLCLFRCWTGLVNIFHQNA